MSSNDYQPPDLASILQTLANLPPQTYQQQSQPSSLPQTPTWPPQTEQTQHPEKWQPALSNPPVAPKNLIDPATIVEWSAGLRCVMKTAAKHESMLSEIRKMIQVQHEHEVQWWRGRDDLVKRQKSREEGQKKLDDVLKLIGGAVSTGNSNVTPEELAKELGTFDMKVHKAQMQMIKEMTSRLRNLGIPFFGTRSDLVIPVGKEEIKDGDSGKKLEKGMIHELELVKLQRKMLAMLEDLCNE